MIHQVVSPFRILLQEVDLPWGMAVQELEQMMGSCGMRPSEVKTLVDVLDTDDDGDMVSWLKPLS